MGFYCILFKADNYDDGDDEYALCCQQGHLGSKSSVATKCTNS